MTKLEQLLVTIVVLALTAFISYSGGFTDGKASSDAQWNIKEGDYRQAEIKLRKDHAQEMGRVVQSNYQTNLKNANDHENALEKVHADLAAARAESKRLGGLRIPAPSCPRGDIGTGTQTAGAGQHHEEATTSIALPERIEAGLWSIVGRADEVTEQLRACQGWILANGFYGEIPPAGD